MIRRLVGVDLGIASAHTAPLPPPTPRPPGAPANAAASTLAGLSTLGAHRRRHTSRPSSASTRAPTGPAWLPVAVFFTARGHRVFRVSRESS